MNAKIHALASVAALSLAALGASLVGTSDAATSHVPTTSRTATVSAVKPVGDCHRVAPADYRLCNTVRAQHSYGHQGSDSTWSSPNGVIIVRDLTHDGLSRSEMHDGLMGERADYVANVTAVRVSVDALKSSDCRWVVSLVDVDHKPGGTKLTKITQDCP